jgi:uncharacterized protein YndB with AHSA1/START domain
METQRKTTIKVSTTVNLPVSKVWKLWTTPEDIVKWNNASNDWHTVKAENDLRTGGTFSSRMESKDGSAGFDFAGTYKKVILNHQIQYTIADSRRVSILFTGAGNKTIIVESFEAEDINPIEFQKQGWQSILNNFKKYAESV